MSSNREDPAVGGPLPDQPAEVAPAAAGDQSIGWAPPGPPGWAPPSGVAPSGPPGGPDSRQPATWSGPTMPFGSSTQPPPHLGAPTAYPPVSGYGQPPPVWVPPVPVYPYAAWHRRAGGYLIDFAPAYVAQIPFWVGYIWLYLRLIRLSTTGGAVPDGFLDLAGPALAWIVVGFVLMLAAIGWQWYNRWLVGGRTGQSLGRRVMRTTLLAEVNGRPIGAVNAFLRDLLHVLDGAAYIGFLWPLWDAKRQTFADMIMKTVVVDLRQPPASAAAVGHPQPRQVAG